MPNSDAKIWCTNVLLDTDDIRGMRYDKPKPPPEDYWTIRYNDGEVVSREDVPELMIAQEYTDPLPDVLLVENRILIVSERVKAVFDGFRLGQTRFHEVTISKIDRLSNYDTRFFVFNIAEHRPILDPNDGNPIMLRPNGKMTFTGSDRGPLELFVNAPPPEDVDLWFHPDLLEAVFTTAALAEAIRAAKVRNFKLYPCPERE